jgi:hypothetical protein
MYAFSIISMELPRNKIIKPVNFMEFYDIFEIFRTGVGTNFLTAIMEPYFTNYPILTTFL